MSLPAPEVASSWACCTCTLCWSLIVIAIYATLFTIRTPLQFYVKYCTYAVIVLAYSFFFIPYAMLRPGAYMNMQVAMSQLAFLFKIFQLRIEVENAKYLQINQPYIVVCNHQSSMDLMVMAKVWPGGNCSVLAKKELLYMGHFGFAMWLCGVTYIDRVHTDKAKQTINSLADQIKDNNLRVWIFPEGTRNLSTRLLPFKKGAFYSAVEAQVPIVCIVASSYLNFYSKRERKFLSNGLVKVNVLPPFQTRGMTLDSIDQLTKHIHDAMQKEFDRLNQEIHLDARYYPSESKSNEEDAADDTSSSTTSTNKTKTTSKSSSSIEKQSAKDDDYNNNSLNDDEANASNSESKKIN